MLCTIQFLQEVFPEWEGRVAPDTPIETVMTDSRASLQGALFIPIVGERFDAHQFIAQAINQGAIAALWDKTQDFPDNYPEDFVFFLVEDTTVALQNLAQAYRNKVNPKVIGITGSNGKTTTKDLLHAVLERKFITYATKGNYNNEIGLPLTILQMNQDTEVLILEMGMSGFHEIDLLTRIAKPDYAIITNIGESHIEHLGSRAGIAKAKLEIAKGLKAEGVLIIDGDEPLLTSYTDYAHVVRCGTRQENDHTVTNIELKSTGTKFLFDRQTCFHLPLLGEHHAKNASFVISLAKMLGLEDEMIQQGFKQLKHSAMRFEKIIGKNDVTLINDAYNASPTSMKAAIEIVKQLQGYDHRVVVLGDVLELGDFSQDLHRSIAEVIEAPINVVYTYGKDAEIITELVKEKFPSIMAKHFTSREGLTDSLQQWTQKETIILFKASRGMAFETFIDALKK